MLRLFSSQQAIISSKVQSIVLVITHLNLSTLDVLRCSYHTSARLQALRLCPAISAHRNSNNAVFFLPPRQAFADVDRTYLNCQTSKPPVILLKISLLYSGRFLMYSNISFGMPPQGLSFTASLSKLKAHHSLFPLTSFQFIYWG